MTTIHRSTLQSSKANKNSNLYRSPSHAYAICVGVQADAGGAEKIPFVIFRCFANGALQWGSQGHSSAPCSSPPDALASTQALVSPATESLHLQLESRCNASGLPRSGPLHFHSATFSFPGCKIEFRVGMSWRTLNSDSLTASQVDWR